MFSSEGFPLSPRNIIPFLRLFLRTLTFFVLIICSFTNLTNAQTSTNRLQLLWRFAPAGQGQPSKPYLTTNELPFERGLTYNPISHRVLVASRSNHVYVLNADTGADLHELNMTGVTGGQYPLLLIKAADDGAIYAGNLNTSTANPQFRLYRWTNDNPGTVATLAFSGDPSPGSSERWGDTLDVRGSGTNTQVLISPRQSTLMAILGTTNGSNFISRTINLPDVPLGHCAMGITFGANNTFWGTTHTNPLRQITFDLAASSGVTTTLHNSNEIPLAICPIGFSPTLNMVAGIHVVSPNHLRVYELSSTNGPPILIGATNFATDVLNVHTAAGSVEFGSNTVYALDANNGIMAVRILPPPSPLLFTGISIQSGQQIFLRGTGSPGSYLLETSSTFTNWTVMTNIVIGTNGTFESFVAITNSSARFYRLKEP